MPTSLMPDEEFHARFRRGLEHYPELPVDPAAWQGMALLLDADARRNTLRRRMLRLFGGELLLLAVLLAALLGRPPHPAAPAGLAGHPGRPGPASRVAAPGEPGRPLAGTPGYRPPGAASAAPAPTASPTKLAADYQPITTRPPAAPAISAPVDMATGRGQQIAAPKGSLAPADDHARHRGRGGERAAAAVTVTAAAPTRQPTGSRALASAPTARQRRRPLSSSFDAPGATGTNPGATTPRLTSPGVARPGPGLTGAGRRRSRTDTQAGTQALAAAPSRRRPVPGEVGRRPASQAAGRTTRARNKFSALGTTSETAGAGTARFGLAAAGLGAVDSLAPRRIGLGGPARFVLPDSLAFSTLALVSWSADSLPVPPPPPGLPAYRLRLGLVAAPELSAVRPSRLAAPGPNVGVQADYQFARRWHLNVSYLLTEKRYVAEPADYNPPTGYPLPNPY